MKNPLFEALDEDDLQEFGIDIIKVCREDGHEMRSANVGWTSAYQSYNSAGDEAEPYCIECEMYLNGDWNFCPSCGIELIWEDEH